MSIVNCELARVNFYDKVHNLRVESKSETKYELLSWSEGFIFTVLRNGTRVLCVKFLHCGSLKTEKRVKSVVSEVEASINLNKTNKRGSENKFYGIYTTPND